MDLYLLMERWELVKAFDVNWKLYWAFEAGVLGANDEQFDRGQRLFQLQQDQLDGGSSQLLHHFWRIRDMQCDSSKRQALNTSSTLKDTNSLENGSKRFVVIAEKLS